MGVPAEHLVLSPRNLDSEEFSLVLGGPLYQLLVRAKLIRPPFGNAARRVIAITGIAALPLIALTIVDGRFSGGTRLPLIQDYAVHTRLLFSLPLLILAEILVHRRMGSIAAQFVERGIIAEGVRPAYNAVLSSANRLRNSLAIEIALLLAVVFAGPLTWHGAVALQSDSWRATLVGSALRPTAAGRWYAFVSIPIFQFILLRWYYRIFIWSRFLFQVSRLDLKLVPLHPDRCCGIGFLGTVTTAFGPILMAHSGLLAGYIANRVLHDGASLPSYKLEIAGLSVILLMMVLGPLCVFLPKLSAAKLAGVRTYGKLASDYVTSFAAKWTSGARTSEPLLGSADIQSMADLDNSYAIVREIKLVPFGRDSVVRFLVLIALPLLPLAFTMFSLEQLLSQIFKLLF